MARFFHWDFFRNRKLRGICLLTVFWLLGLLSGVALFRASGTPNSTALRESVMGDISLIESLTVMCVPFLISAIAFSFSGPYLLFVYVFGKGVCVSFAMLSVSAAFGTAGWLMRCLVMFADFWILPWLFWFWIGALNGRQKFLMRSGVVCLLVVLMGALLDSRFISPLLQRL